MFKQLAAGGRIEIRDFGSFNITYRPPRVGRNPKTEEKVQIPSKAVPRFKPGLELRRCVNGNKRFKL